MSLTCETEAVTAVHLVGIYFQKQYSSGFFAGRTPCAATKIWRYFFWNVIIASTEDLLGIASFNHSDFCSYMVSHSPNVTINLMHLHTAAMSYASLFDFMMKIFEIVKFYLRTDFKLLVELSLSLLILSSLSFQILLIIDLIL